MGLLSSIGDIFGSVGDFIGDTVGAVVSPVTSIAGSVLGLTEARNKRHHEKSEFDYEHWWQENMANSAHQREVSDLRAAGINPILTATGGNGAAVGSVSGHVTPMSDASAATSARQLALQKALQLEQFKEIASVITKNEADAKLADEQREQAIMNGIVQRDFMRSQEQNSAADTRVKNIQADLNSLDYRLQKAIKGAQSDFFETPVGQAAVGWKSLTDHLMPSLPGAFIQVGSSAKTAGQSPTIRESKPMNSDTGWFTIKSGKYKGKMVNMKTGEVR